MKIFTHVLAGIRELAAAASPPNDELMAAFVAQEDITVIGFMLWQEIATPLIANDGWAACVMELTPQAQFGQPGSLGQIGAGEIWNTGPAAVQIVPASISVMFPKGDGITVKEEGVLNVITSGWNTSAATCRFSPHAFIYYVKGSLHR